MLPVFKIYGKIIPNGINNLVLTVIKKINPDWAVRSMVMGPQGMSIDGNASSAAVAASAAANYATTAAAAASAAAAAAAADAAAAATAAAAVL